MTDEPVSPTVGEDLLSAEASTFGCGSPTCAACYPRQYRCGVCGVDFESPIANPDITGEPHVCANCGYDQIDPDTADMQAKSADGFCLSCGEPHESESCPIYTNEEKT